MWFVLNLIAQSGTQRGQVRAQTGTELLPALSGVSQLSAAVMSLCTCPPVPETISQVESPGPVQATGTAAGLSFLTPGSEAVVTVRTDSVLFLSHLQDKYNFHIRSLNHFTDEERFIISSIRNLPAAHSFHFTPHVWMMKSSNSRV